jgi:hypothetical protein
MSPVHFTRALKDTLLLLLVCAAITGCSKQAEKPAAASSAVDSVAAVPLSATTPAAVPTTSISVPADIKQAFAEADAALKAKAYQRSVQCLLAVQNQNQLTDQQAEEARRRMVGLQSSLADGIANGDPNAIAAAELLRRSATRQ